MIKKYVEINFGEGDVKMMAADVVEFPDAVAVFLKNGEPRPIGPVENDPDFMWDFDESDMVWMFKDFKSIRIIAAWLEEVARQKERKMEAGNDQT